MRELQYPIGTFEAPAVVTPAQLEQWIDTIARLPEELRVVIEALDAGQQDTPNRPGGWTVSQVVHHLADSHVNSYVRFRWALTEERPTIKAYDEKAWAELADARGPVSLSLDLLDALHRRWVALLSALQPEQLARTFVHPETDDRVRLDVNVGIYAWHGRHHLAHVVRLAEREGWELPKGTPCA